MKKLISLALAMLLCIGAVAMAEPSKSTADLTEVLETKTESGVVPSDLEVAPAKKDEATQAQNEQCQKMIEEMTAAKENNGSAVAAFSNVKDVAGNNVNVAELLDTDEDKLVVKEAMPLTVKGYDSSYGSVTGNYNCAAQYGKGEKLVVIVRVYDPKTGETTEFALLGTGTGTGFEVEFPPEVLLLAQDGIATMAVVSK